MPRDDSAAYSSRCGTFEWCDADYARSYLPRRFCEQLASSIAPTILGIDAQPGESLWFSSLLTWGADWILSSQVSIALRIASVCVTPTSTCTATSARRWRLSPLGKSIT